ncbi:delta subunit of the central stalk of mitochondrial F1F0 ATP synthase, atp16 [Coemansia sp. RSA 1813]|nr:delta subunit of the central stalk of mitochondrial F1F0 ATP synthase, atp16 [Coemansia sp. RSA 1646]KAJ1769109.1 delta subunit of the central stalk of mitochondrial F1F0 ATP synthase, atp16 [Coemansia sp. RSA 1843]KAJ2088383.1 delta subunit of the central stalk of mitochondrial F1F0 ATP synthase, atp16 [Coemansia sp. RSA 986]KAJ2213823.1 delta subunit of the central stalk of mitochondrial F1F0 ATP synthase, atp16 [Coemansia sp. RSA 487]KAJ2569865.1 delta subunit of the central stalk of mito
MSLFARALKPAASSAVRLAIRGYASEAAAASGGKLIVNFALPHQTVLKKHEVNQVDMSAVSGDLGILADHVPTIEQLKPGVLDIIGDGGSTKYFVSGGFAIMNPNSVLNINAIEAFKLEDLDAQAVATNLAESQRLLTSAKDETAKEAAAIEVELYESIQAALTGKSK